MCGVALFPGGYGKIADNMPRNLRHAAQSAITELVKCCSKAELNGLHLVGAII
jgi:hypothetical protein